MLNKHIIYFPCDAEPQRAASAPLLLSAIFHCLISPETCPSASLFTYKYLELRIQTFKATRWSHTTKLTNKCMKNISIFLIIYPRIFFRPA